MKQKLWLKIVSIGGLILTLTPSFFVFGREINLSTDKLLMLIGTLIWFLIAPFWMNKSVKS